MIGPSASSHCQQQRRAAYLDNMVMAPSWLDGLTRSLAAKVTAEVRFLRGSPPSGETIIAPLPLLTVAAALRCKVWSSRRSSRRCRLAAAVAAAVVTAAVAAAVATAVVATAAATAVVAAAAVVAVAAAALYFVCVYRTRVWGPC